MKSKLLIAVGIVLVVVLVALLAIPGPQPEPPLPSPNGYDDFIKATTQLSGNTPDWQSMAGEEQHAALERFIASNEVVLATVRVGLSKECRMVPWVNATNNTHLNGLAMTKVIAQTFAAASRLALIEGRTNEAAAFAVDCIRYGNESARGGVLIDGLVGIAIKNIGLSGLKAAMDGIELETTRKALSEVAAVQAHTESADEIIKRERQWAQRGRFGPIGIIGQLVQPILNRAAYAKWRQKASKIDSDLSRAQIQLAAHAYELDHGQPPATARELVPQYLKSVPLDPATGRELPLN